MVKREQFDPLGPTVETAMAINLPHVSVNAQAILTEFFERYLERSSAAITDAAVFGGEYWRIDDVHTNSPLQITSDLWDPPGPRSIVLPEVPRPVPHSLPLYSNDPVSELMQALALSSYNPEAITQDGDPITAGQVLLVAGTIATEVILGVIPIIGDGRDIFEEIWNFATGSDDTSYLVFSLAVLGLSADLGSMVAPPLGVPANLVIAAIKGIVKAIPKFITKGIMRAAGGLVSGTRRLASYVWQHTMNADCCVVMDQAVGGDLDFTDYSAFQMSIGNNPGAEPRWYSTGVRPYSHQASPS